MYRCSLVKLSCEQDQMVRFLDLDLEMVVYDAN